MNILEVSGKLNIGGAQLVAANISKYAAPDMRFFYLVFGDEIGEYEEEIMKRGDCIIHVPPPNENQLYFLINTIRLIRKNRFDVVHAHTMFNCGTVMLAAKIAGVKGRISHSHTINDESPKTLKRLTYKCIMRWLIKCFGTDWCACGVDAGNVLYGEKWFSKYGKVIKNGIDTEKFRFSDINRTTIRKDYGVEGRFVIGHIGHYVKVKNQRFLISMMPELLLKRPDAVLLLFGDGVDRDTLSEQIQTEGLTESVQLIGNVDNISQVLSAFDVFVLPSFFEGTPLALIEAQTNGVPCVISTAIPGDACITKTIARLDLNQPVSDWIQTICSAKRDAEKNSAELVEKQYGSIKLTMDELYKVFRKYDNQ